jgi:anaerobic magnesium-protoporphyrin IX monomethyl ester cyclase
MNQVLITHSYFYQLDEKQWQTKQPYPPLGTLQAAAVIRSNGFNVSLFDVGLKASAQSIEPTIKKLAPTYFVIYDDGFNYLTKMCLTVMRDAAFTMAQLAKQNGSIVIICSSDSTDHYEKYFAQGVDYVVRGEGEETIAELLKCLEKKESLEMVAGLAYRNGNETVVTKPRAVMRDLDSLPMPAWDLIDLEPYRQLWIKHHGYFSLNIATTRGCPYKCNWCAKPIYGNRYNSRAPERVVDEIEFLLKKYQPNHFWMCDDIFGLKPGWVQKFENLVTTRNLKFKYKIQSRVDLLLEDDTVSALARSGVETIWVGAESGSQKILDAMDKGTTVSQIYEATKLLKSKGIQTAFFLQFGYSGETKEDIDATLKMVLDLMPDDIGISVSYPLPGTKFYENVKTQMGTKQNWSDSDEMAMMFHGTFKSTFYKKLHRYVHHKYRAKKGYLTIQKLMRKPQVASHRDLKRGILALYHTVASFVYERNLAKIE